MCSISESKMETQTIVFQPKSENVVVASHGKLVELVNPALGFRIPCLFKGSTSLAGHTMTNTAAVVLLDKKEELPPSFIASFPQGPREFFATAANFR